MLKPVEEQKIRPNRLSLEADKIVPREGLVVDREEDTGAQSSVRGVRRGRDAAANKGGKSRRQKMPPRRGGGEETDGKRNGLRLKRCGV
ncbi:hypothetical protein B296_00023252 [Ensete ventricosum]|uniref:Uncharacterized protein n=1 Tax=Ensete ventricosum TaxID=4639 RepID=A0A427AJN2_ENSVE|nr:hypothetical protein B296_00023252 [Ensete ventricosum]